MHPILYPYTSEARKYLESQQTVSDEQLERAKARVENRLKGSEWKENSAHEEAIEFALARMLLAASGNAFMTRQYARAEAKHVIRALQDEDPQAFAAFAKDQYPSLSLEENRFLISLNDYLRFGTDLVNAPLRNGKLLFEKPEFLQLLRAAIEARIATTTGDAKKIPANVKRVSRELEERIRKQQPQLQRTFKGKYLELPAMQLILLGVGEGKRYYGSMTLSIACLKDGIPKLEAEHVMRMYARNCSTGGNTFTEREALNSLEWVYKHPTIRFSLKTLREQGLVDAETMQKTEEEYRRMRKGERATRKGVK
ncbi:hypothetical protein KJ765_04700 [Candidatus Micrarchaeota archaeon]|nr:hypothetical protein [Candidatus Micrarchaeota archaeon]